MDVSLFFSLTDRFQNGCKGFFSFNFLMFKGDVQGECLHNGCCGVLLCFAARQIVILKCIAVGDL